MRTLKLVTVRPDARAIALRLLLTPTLGVEPPYDPEGLYHRRVRIAAAKQKAHAKP